jgi:Holliday junction resolvasome RuvABC endonuclease subunit
MGQDADGIQVINADNGEAIHLGSGTVITDVTQELGHRIPKVEDVIDSDQ